MSGALELITVQDTGPDTGGTANAVAGNSLTIRQAPRNAMLIGLWQTRTAAGFTRITSPLMHDSLVGLQMRGAAGQVVGMQSAKTPVFPQDTLSCTISGDASAVEHSSWLVHYPELPGVSASCITYAELMTRGLEITGIFNTLTPGTTAFGSQVAINATNDNLKANDDYAIVGATIQAGVATIGTHAVRYTSVDFGNLGVGLPASALSNVAFGANWFADLARDTGLPTIPVFNSANKTLTLVDAIGAAATSTTIATLLVRLSKRGAGRGGRRGR
jgi:hypothetical protein